MCVCAKMVVSEESGGVAYDDIAVVTSTPSAGDLCFDQHALQVRLRDTTLSIYLFTQREQ